MQVSTRDESGALTIQGSKQSSFGGMAADGPPTTMSDTGVDRLAFLQANVVRDATFYMNGTSVGARDLFQVCLLSHAARPPAHAYAPGSIFIWLSPWLSNPELNLSQVRQRSQVPCPLARIEPLSLLPMK